MNVNPIKKQILNYFLVILGTFLLSFGSVIFLSECEIVNGGISGMAVIIQHFVPIQIYDYLVAGFTAFFWIIGLIFVGKDFSMKSLLSSILYIGFTFLFKRVTFFTDLAKEFAGTLNGGTTEVGNLILCGLFGGVFVGGGVGIAFLGGGSTGGVDVLQVLMKKHLNIKESLSSVLLEAIIILIGMFALQKWIPSLCGILCAVTTALLVQIVYNNSQTSYQADIISDKWELISWYAQEELGRGATIIKAQGGYKGDERIILRVVFDKQQYTKLKDFISKVDPKAFITFTQTNAVYGEGFNNNTISLTSLIKSAKKMKKEKEKEKK